MLPSKLYSIENVHRSKLALTAFIVVAGLLCSYLLYNTAMCAMEIVDERVALKDENEQAESLKKTADDMQFQVSRGVGKIAGGVESFFVQAAQWAKAGGLSVDSLVPEGAAVDSQIKTGDVDLGKWAACKLRFKGSGSYAGLKSMLDRFKEPSIPMKLDSLSINSANSTGKNISFDLVVIVYQKKSGEG